MYVMHAMCAVVLLLQTRWHALHELVIMLEQELLELAAATQQLLLVAGCQP